MTAPGRCMTRAPGGHSPTRSTSRSLRSTPGQTGPIGVRRAHARRELDVDAELVRALLRIPVPRALRADAGARSSPGGPTTRSGAWARTWSSGCPGSAGRWASPITTRPFCRGVAAALPVAVPEPVAVGEPGEGYPHRWSVHRWLPAAVRRTWRLLVDPVRVRHGPGGGRARAGRARLDAVRPPPPIGRGRSGPVRGGRARGDRRRGRVSSTPTRPAGSGRRPSQAPAHDGPPVWVHGDLEGNCLTADGRLAGIVDWGSACGGDPAVDIQVVWSPLFTSESRNAFLRSLDGRRGERAPEPGRRRAAGVRGAAVLPRLLSRDRAALVAQARRARSRPASAYGSGRRRRPARLIGLAP